MKLHQKIIIFAGAGLCVISSYAAEIIVSREFIYPSSYTDPQVSTGNGNGNGTSGVAVVGPSPSGFTMREIGVRLTVVATVSELAQRDTGIDMIKNSAQRKSTPLTHGNTELMVAATSGSFTDVRNLILRKAEVNAKNEYGSTALMGASAGGHEEIVKALLEAGAEVDVANQNGSTSLMFAAKNGHTKVVNLLLEKKADPNIKDQNEQTALFYAIGGKQQMDVVKALIAKGADVNVVSTLGTTALKAANNKMDQNLVLLLTKAGAVK